MPVPNLKGDQLQATLAKTVEAVHSLQQSVQHNDVRLKQMEEASNVFNDTQAKMDDKIDNMFKMMQQWNVASEFGSAQKLEVAGKITLQQEPYTQTTIPTTNPIPPGPSTLPLNQIPTHSEPGFVYIQPLPNINTQPKQPPQNQETFPYTTTQTHTPHNMHPYRDNNS
jgi:hypothetical protein